MQEFHREFLRMAGLTFAGGATTLVRPAAAEAQPSRAATSVRDVYFNVRSYGAKGDGSTIDSPAINAAIDAAANAGGGTVVFAAGTYASYSIRLKSNVALYLQQGATIRAAPTLNGKGYDAQEPQTQLLRRIRTTATTTVARGFSRRDSQATPMEPGFSR